jgi:hyperosmotically inducible periplasmic protein
MTRPRVFTWILSTVLFVSITSLARAQSADSNAKPSSEWSSMKSAGNSAEGAVSRSYYAAKTAVEDTTITSRVEWALHEDKLTHGQDIHVDTYGGVVTLSGTAPSAQVADRAIAVTKATRGVENVKDAITVVSRSSMR